MPPRNNVSMWLCLGLRSLAGAEPTLKQGTQKRAKFQATSDHREGTWGLHPLHQLQCMNAGVNPLVSAVSVFNPALISSSGRWNRELPGHREKHHRGLRVSALAFSHHSPKGFAFCELVSKQIFRGVGKEPLHHFRFCFLVFEKGVNTLQRISSCSIHWIRGRMKVVCVWWAVSLQVIRRTQWASRFWTLWPAPRVYLPLSWFFFYFFLNRISAKCWAQSLFMFWWSKNGSFLPARLETFSLLTFSWIRACNFFKPVGNKLVCILSFRSSWDHQQRCEFCFVIHCQMHPFI